MLFNEFEFEWSQTAGSLIVLYICLIKKAICQFSLQVPIFFDVSECCEVPVLSIRAMYALTMVFVCGSAGWGIIYFKRSVRI